MRGSLVGGLFAKKNENIVDEFLEHQRVLQVHPIEFSTREKLHFQMDSFRVRWLKLARKNATSREQRSSVLYDKSGVSSQRRWRCLLKSFPQLRIYVADLPTSRLHLQFEKNLTLIRLLKRFYNSVVGGQEVFEFVAQLPKLLYVKKENWMTRKLLEPDLKKIKNVAPQ